MLRGAFVNHQVQFIKADALDITQHVEAESVQAIITSPNYNGPRVAPSEHDHEWPDGWHGDYGAEDNVTAYTEHTMLFLDQFKKVLKPEGVLFWQLSDRHSMAWPDGSPSLPQLQLTPERFAVAASDRDWLPVARIVWVLPFFNREPMRYLSPAHFVIWVLARHGRYRWHPEAIMEELPDGRPYTARNVQAWAPEQRYKHPEFGTFPVEMAEWCIRASTRPGDVVCDPFAGSGTVGVAAKKLGRSAILIDLKYQDVQKERCGKGGE